MNLSYYEEHAPPGIFALLKRLDAGNFRFKANHPKQRIFDIQRKELLSGQRPYAIIVTCSDSRIVPHYIFDEDIGTIFTVRNAGNVIDSATLGSIEFAVDHLKSKILLIMGHDDCGAVKAALKGGSPHKYICHALEMIHPSINNVRERYPDFEEILHEATIQNVKDQMNIVIERSEVVRDYIQRGELLVVGGMYDMDSGDVDFI